MDQVVKMPKSKSHQQEGYGRSDRYRIRPVSDLQSHRAIQVSVIDSDGSEDARKSYNYIPHHTMVTTN